MVMTVEIKIEVSLESSIKGNILRVLAKEYFRALLNQLGVYDSTQYIKFHSQFNNTFEGQKKNGDRKIIEAMNQPIEGSKYFQLLPADKTPILTTSSLPLNVRHPNQVIILTALADYHQLHHGPTSTPL